MVAYLTKSDASEGINQVIDFLNGSYIKYALTVNPNIYVSCIKQFWNTVVIKKDNDVTRLQALVDKKKVVITEATIIEVLRLDDAERVDFLPNKEIFEEMARMGYEKPSTKLIFYKAFFSSQWKFLIHTILQSMSAKRTSWNEFSSAMTSAVICLSTGRKFNFSRYIFDSLVRNVDSTSKFYMYPRFTQLLIRKQIGDLSTYTTKYTSPALTQKEEMKKSMLKLILLLKEMILLLKEMILLLNEKMLKNQPYHLLLHLIHHHNHLKIFIPEALDACTALKRRVEHLEYNKVAQALEITKLKRRVKKLEKEDTVMDDASNQWRIIDEMDRDDAVALMDDKEEDNKEEEAKVIEDDQVQERQAASQAKIYKIDMDHALKVLIMQEDEPDEVCEVVDVVTTAKVITEVVTAASETITAARVVIREPEEESTTSSILPADTKSKDKGKGIMVKKPKPLKKKQQVEMDEEYARKLDYFKGMSNDDIRLIFEVKFNSNIEFLLKIKEQMEEEESIALKSINETPAQKAAKRRKLNEKLEDLKRHLEIVPDEDDDMYTEATSLERKIDMLKFGRIKGLYMVKQRKKIPTLKVYTRSNAECSETLSGRRLSATKQKMLLLDSVAEGTLMLLSQVKTVNDKCCC
nr:hypothetical protein [Tanacetum cinerariifolium]